MSAEILASEVATRASRLRIPFGANNTALARIALRFEPTRNAKEAMMKNPLESIWGTIICGLILTAVLYWAAQALLH